MSIQREASIKEVHSKKSGKLENNGSPSLMTIEQSKCSQGTTSGRRAQNLVVRQALNQAEIKGMVWLG